MDLVIVFPNEHSHDEIKISKKFKKKKKKQYKYNKYFNSKGQYISVKIFNLFNIGMSKIITNIRDGT